MWVLGLLIWCMNSMTPLLSLRILLLHVPCRYMGAQHRWEVSYCCPEFDPDWCDLVERSSDIMQSRCTNTYSREWKPSLSPNCFSIWEFLQNTSLRNSHNWPCSGEGISFPVRMSSWPRWTKSIIKTCQGPTIWHSTGPTSRHWWAKRELTPLATRVLKRIRRRIT